MKSFMHRRVYWTKWCLLSVVCILNAWAVRALEPTRQASAYSIQSWFTEHGLPSYKIRAVTQTRDGYLWIVTAQGIARFDGSQFTSFTPETNPELRGGGFFAVQEAPDGRLWFGGDKGLFRWNNGHFDHFTTEQGLANNYVRGLTLTKKGDIVALTLTGYSFIRSNGIVTPGGEWKQVSGVARSFLEKSDGSMLLGTSEGLWRFSGQHIQKLSGTPELDGDAFSSLLETSDGSTWIGYSQGIRRIYPGGKIEDYGAAQGLAHPGVAALDMDRDGNLWIGTYDGGLYRMTKGRIEETIYAEHFGVTPIRQIFEDREGGVWIATAAGLFCLKDNVGSCIGTAEGMRETSVFAVLEASDGVWWIGLWGGGIYRFDKGHAIRLALSSDLHLDQVLSLAEEPAGTLWIGAISGLYRYDREGVTNLYVQERAADWQKLLHENPDTVLPGIAHKRANSVVADGAGGLWVATEDALYHGREGSFRAYTASNGLPGNSYKAVLRARNGDVWVTAQPDGVGRLHDGQWIKYRCGRDISSVVPRAVFEDAAGTIWVTTEGGGLNQFKDGKWHIFTVHDGLADDFISGITEDNFRNLWIACPHGFMRIPCTQFDDFVAGRRTTLVPRIFNRSDGLPAAEANHSGSPSAWRARDGRLLFATDLGVAVIEPRDIKISHLLTPMYIERLVVNGSDADLSRPVVVPPGNNDVQIHYTAISLSAAEKVRFKIRLAPLDRDWVDAGSHREVHYAKLPPGDYTFRMIACNTDGIWNEESVATTFRVQPHFYQTAWFIGTIALGVGGTILGVYWMRARQMVKLERQVTERTRELRLAKEAAEAAVIAKNESIVALKQAEMEQENLHKQLLETSRKAGMSEVASNVLHNVGNVLNSVNVSATLAAEIARGSKSVQLGKVVALLDQHELDLAQFLTNDPKGTKIPGYLRKLHSHLAVEQQTSITELESLRKNIEHIKDIVTMQQSYARVSGLTEVVKVADLVEDSLSMNDGALQRHGVRVVREYDEVPVITVEKHKVLQILVNLIRNAKYACDEGSPAEKRMTVSIGSVDESIKISVADNGVGIPLENLTRIFNHGFTTRKNGHGFGLHSGALAARDLGGTLSVHSAGPGLGATFTLELPIKKEKEQV